MEKTLYMLKLVLEDGIKSIVRKEDITPAELDNVTKALCAIEQIKRIGGNDAEVYSGRSYTSRNSRHDDDDKYFYRRDNKGKIADKNTEDAGYSGHSIRDRMIDKLEQMMDSAKSEHERRTIKEWIRRLEEERN